MKKILLLIPLLLVVGCSNRQETLNQTISNMNELNQYEANIEFEAIANFEGQTNGMDLNINVIYDAANTILKQNTQGDYFGTSISESIVVDNTLENTNYYTGSEESGYYKVSYDVSDINPIKFSDVLDNEFDYKKGTYNFVISPDEFHNLIGQDVSGGSTYDEIVANVTIEDEYVQKIEVITVSDAQGVAVNMNLLIEFINFNQETNIKEPTNIVVMEDEFYNAFESSSNNLIYIGRPSCSYCALLEPSLNDMAERYGFEYTYLNTDYMSDAEFNLIMDELGLDPTEFGTPYLAVLKNSKVIDEQPGYVDGDVLFDMLQDNSIIDSKEKLNLNYVDYSEFEDLFYDSSKSIVVLGQSTCSYCIDAKVVLNDINEETSLEINYFNIDYITEDEFNDFLKLDEFFESEWGTPTTLILEDGKVVSTFAGYADKDGFTTYFKEQGFLN